MSLVHFRRQSGWTGAKSLVESQEVSISRFGLPGILRVPAGAKALVVFAHGSGASRLSPRNRAVAQALAEQAIATLLFDLLTETEAEASNNVLDIDLLTNRLIEAVAWIDGKPQLRDFPLGFFGAHTGAAAALVAAARLGSRVGAIVSRGGRPDLAKNLLGAVFTPTLLIVGGQDAELIALNEQILPSLQGPKAIEIVPGAGHLFREPGALTAVTKHAARWCQDYLMKGEAEGSAPSQSIGAT
ncbi:Putative phosphoribosyl transferase [Methylovirgula sp. HY1]|nr:Putative phosphoribosyl transferase [Methylovirgula sp. HY1]